MGRKMAFDPFKDFDAVTELGIVPNIVVVNPESKIHSIKDLIATAKAEPGKLNFGSGGVGTGTHLATELFDKDTGIKMVHIPFKGTPPALTALMAGRIQVIFAGAPPSPAAGAQRQDPGNRRDQPQEVAGRAQPAADLGHRARLRRRDLVRPAGTARERPSRSSTSSTPPSRRCSPSRRCKRRCSSAASWPKAARPPRPPRTCGKRSTATEDHQGSGHPPRSLMALCAAGVTRMRPTAHTNRTRWPQWPPRPAPAAAGDDGRRTDNTSRSFQKALAAMDIVHNLMLGFSVALSAENLLYCLIGRLHRDADRRAAGPRADGDGQHPVAAHLPPAADLGAHHAGRHLLRLHVRRLHIRHPHQPAGRSLARGDVARRPSDGPAGPRRRRAGHGGDRLLHRRHRSPR